jgi:hypothetical protein
VALASLAEKNWAQRPPVRLWSRILADRIGTIELVQLGAVGANFRSSSRAEFCAKILPRGNSGGTIFRRAAGRFLGVIFRRLGGVFGTVIPPCSQDRFRQFITPQNQLRQSHESGREFELECPPTEQGLSMDFHPGFTQSPTSDNVSYVRLKPLFFPRKTHVCRSAAPSVHKKPHVAKTPRALTKWGRDCDNEYRIGGPSTTSAYALATWRSNSCRGGFFVNTRPAVLPALP